MNLSKSSAKIVTNIPICIKYSKPCKNVEFFSAKQQLICGVFSQYDNDFKVKNEAKQLGLQVRGTHGEHSDVKGGIMDISNARRLGLTEYEAINQVYTGVNKILDLDRQGK